MTLRDELDKLSLQFDAVAHAMAGEIPEVWDAALSAYKGDRKAAVDFLLQRNIFLSGKAVERALESEEGKQAVLKYLSQIESGVYL